MNVISFKKLYDDMRLENDKLRGEVNLLYHEVYRLNSRINELEAHTEIINRETMDIRNDIKSIKAMIF